MKNKKGFSIGEVMVAAFILITGIVAAVVLTVKSTDNIGDSRRATIASALAQEGAELVRNVRDNNVTEQTCGGGSDRCTAFDGNGFLNLSSSETKHTIGYSIKGDDVLRMHAAGLERLYINPHNYAYTHIPGGANVSPFKRMIFISYETSTGVPLMSAEDDEIIANITSVVVWEKGVLPNNASNIEDECKIGKNCAFAQTKLTSWINYD